MAASTQQPDTAEKRLLVQYAVARALAEAATAEDALSRVLAEIGSILGWRFGAFWLLDEGREMLRPAAVWRADQRLAELADATRATSCARGRGLPGRVWERGQPVLISGLLDLDSAPRRTSAERAGLRSAFAFPIFSSSAPSVSEASAGEGGPRLLGVVELFSDAMQAPDEPVLEAAAGLAYQLGAYLERRRALDAELIARGRNAAVVEVALDCIIMMDHEGRILEWNPAAERTFGRPRAAVLGRQLGETIVPPHLRDAHYRGFARYLQTGEAHVLGRRIEVEGMRRDGSLFPCELAITRVPLPGPAVFTAYLRDLTERRRLESAHELLLHASGVLLASLDYEQTLKNLSEVVVPAFADWYSVDIVDADQTIRRLETSHREPAKRRLAEELARRFADRPETAYGARAAIRSGGSQLVSDVTDDVLALTAQNGDHLELLRTLGLRSFMVVPLRAHDEVLGAITFVTAESGRRYDERDLSVAEELALRAGQAIENARLFADVAESRELLEQQAPELEAQAEELEGGAAVLESSNEELRAANEELAKRTEEAERVRTEAEDARREADEANRAKGEFLAAMSHELRTPLNAIIGYSELLDVGIHGPVNGEQHENLQRIERSAQHLLGLINDILNFAKLERGRVQYDMAPLKVEDVLASVEELVAPLAGAKRLTYRLDVDCPGVQVFADREKLRQIFVNLLSNAIRFTKEGGEIRVSCAADRTHVFARVRDTGVGILTDKLESIFEPFVQVDREYVGQRQGTGLGLAISRELARGMGGDLTAASEVGVGSVFTLTLRRHSTA